jgi:GntR family transcriptional regulator
MPRLKYFLDLISVPSLILSLKPRQHGSFAAESSVHFEPTKLKLTGMIEDIIAMSTQTRTRILNFGFVHPPKKVREHLGLNGDAKVLRIERIRFIKGQPISYMVSCIPSDLGAKINIKDLVVQPLMNVLEDKCKIRIVKGSQVIGATLADARVASFLEVMTGSPLLKIERVAFDARNRPVEYISILYRSDRYHFNVDFTRKRSESKDRWADVGP